MTKLRILVVDDHPFVLEGLKTKISTHPDLELVGEATDGRTAIQRAVELRPDVIVMDVSMPKLSGAQATREIRRLCPASKIVALTVHEDRMYLRDLLGAGVSGYVLKRSAVEELLRAIFVAASGGTFLDPVIADKVVSRFVGRPINSDSVQCELSDREAEVLRLIAQGFSNKEIGAKLHLSVKTVETYRSRAMEKLGLESRADVVSYAVHRGWLRDD